MNKTLTFLCLVALSLSCTKQESELALLRVGRFEIKQKDANYRDQIVQIFYPGNKTANAGFIQLKDSFTMAMVMENNGHLINDHKLINESSRIDASTKDPKTLERIKLIFKKNLKEFDEASYRKVFILPNYVDRNITSLFQSLPIHEKTRAEAIALYQVAVLDPRQILALGKKENKKHGHLCVSRKEGISFEEGKRKKKGKVNAAGASVVDLSTRPNKEVYDEIHRQMSGKDDVMAERWLNEIATPTSVGKMVNKIIDHSDSWLILRLVEKKKDEACFEAVIFQKVSFPDWFESEKKKIEQNLMN